jgi:hypothetical protein
MPKPILKRVGQYQAVRRMTDSEFRLKFKTRHMDRLGVEIFWQS